MTRNPYPEVTAENATLALNLERQGMHVVPDAGTARVVCLEGALWITLDYDTRDIVLEPCEVFTTPEHRRAVIYALKPSRLSVTSLARPGALPLACGKPRVGSRDAGPTLRWLLALSGIRRLRFANLRQFYWCFIQ